MAVRDMSNMVNKIQVPLTQYESVSRGGVWSTITESAKKNLGNAAALYAKSGLTPQDELSLIKGFSTHLASKRFLPSHNESFCRTLPKLIRSPNRLGCFKIKKVTPHIDTIDSCKQ